MAAGKLSGLGGAVTLADASGTVQTITDDVTNWTLATPRGVQDVTGVGKSANERILLLADISITYNGVFDDAAGMSHAVLKTIPSTSVARASVITPTVDGTAMSNNVLLTDYNITRSTAGDLTWSVPAVLSDGTVPSWS
jgi:hypothetical protein